MTALHQARSLTEPLARTPRAPAPWIAVSGGKGGVGKTLIAVNLAIVAARAGYRTLLVDFDPGLANVDVHLRLAPRLRLEALARGACSPAEAVVTGPAGIGVLCGESGSTALASGDTALWDAAHAAVERAARGFDLVVCDTGAGIGPAVLHSAQRAALVLAVTTPDPAAATDAYALIKLLLQRGQALPHLAVNRARDRAQALRTSARLASVCGKFLGRTVPLAGWLRDDARIAHSIAAQRPFALDGDGPALDDVRTLAAHALSAIPSVRRAAPGGRETSQPPGA